MPGEWAIPALPLSGWPSTSCKHACTRASPCSHSAPRQPRICLEDFAMCGGEQHEPLQGGSEWILAVEGLWKHFCARKALHQFFLSVAPGEIFWVGRGKRRGQKNFIRDL